MTSIKAVIFDVGGVLVDTSVEAETALFREIFGLNDEQVAAVWELMSGSLDGGRISEADFWHKLSTDFGIREVTPAENLLGDFLKKNCPKNESALELVGKLKRSRVKLAVLSDTCEAHARALTEMGVYDNFDLLVLSYQVKMLKPDPRIFQHALNRLAVAPAEALFIDDKPANVEAARRLGMRGIICDNPDDLERLCVEAGVVL